MEPSDLAPIALRGVRVIDPLTRRDEVLDVVIDRGVITRIGAGAARGLPPFRTATEGMLALPGFVDLHTHLREPGFESKEEIATGLRAAARGGFVHVCVMPNTNPVNDNARVTRSMVRRAAECGGVRLSPIGAITRDQRGEELAEMGGMKDAGAVAVSDDGRCVMSSAVMRRALEYARTVGLPVIQHAEDHQLTSGADMHEGEISTRLGLRGWPRVAEDVIVARDLLLAEYTGAQYHLAHASTEGAVRLVREAKQRGLRVTAEVTPHHLLLTHEAVLGFNTMAKVNPPLRERHDLEALIAALADGTIDCVATDHAPHGAEDKSCAFSEAAMGISGLESCFALVASLVHRGHLSWMRLAEVLSTAPARIVGLDPPRLSEGAPADIVLIAPKERWALDVRESKGKNSPFLGQEVEGRVRMTFVSGKIVYAEESR